MSCYDWPQDILEKNPSKHELVQLWSYGRWLNMSVLTSSSWVSCRGTAKTLQKNWHSSGKQKHTALFNRNHSRGAKSYAKSYAVSVLAPFHSHFYQQLSKLLKLDVLMLTVNNKHFLHLQNCAYGKLQYQNIPFNFISWMRVLQIEYKIKSQSHMKLSVGYNFPFLLKENCVRNHS